MKVLVCGGRMKTVIVMVGWCLLLGACDKIGGSGTLSQFIGNWAEVRLPANCKAKQISAEESNGVAVLCEDGRVFH